MSSQNIYSLFTDDPVEYNRQALKTKLALALIALIREQGWTQAIAAERLQISQPRMSNLFTGRLERFSIDSLLEMLFRSGYKLDCDFDPANRARPMEMALKKAML